MDRKNASTLTALLFVSSLILFPIGCGGQPQEVELDLRIDDTPIERKTETSVNSYAGVLRVARPAVVSVFSQRLLNEGERTDYPSLEQFFGENPEAPERMQRGVGSGVIVSPQGYVLTNNHVIEDAERVLVQMSDGGGQVEAEVVGRDPATDIAVLRIEVEEDVPFAVLGDSDSIEVGDIVFALGNALGIGHSVTSGIVSARGRTGIGILGEDGYEDFIQTDASMNIGNSGGALVDTKGRIIGINTAIASPGGGNVGIGFAIPINMARNVMENLLEHGEVRRGYLGLTLQNPGADFPREYGAPARDGVANGEGVVIVNVVEDSPAAEAGLEAGDVVVELDGQPVESASDLRLQIAQLGPETEVELGVVRDGERMNVHAVLGVLEEAVQRSIPEDLSGSELLPGFSVAPLTEELREQFGFPSEVSGLIVTDVEEDSPYGDLFPIGGVIMRINREEVEDVEMAREEINPGRNLFLLFHAGSYHYIVVEVEEE